MTKNRICATEEDLSKRGDIKPHDMFPGRDFPDNAADKILQVKGLARIGAAASDSLLTIDLSECGYLALFEVINRLCEEIWPEIDELHHEARVGIYAHFPSASDTDNLEAAS